LPGTAAASVVVTLGNDGTRLGKPALSVALTGPNGYQRTAKRPLDTLLPGDYTISVTATPGPASAKGAPGAATVHTVTAHLGTALAGVPSPGVITPVPASHGHSGRGYPMGLVVVAVAVAGVGGGLYLGRRGGRPKPPAEEPVLATEGVAPHPVDR